MQAIPKKTRDRLFLLLLAVFCALGIWSIFVPSNISWDGSVYVGMGKFLFSHGTIGVWETLRPVGFPIVLGALWKIGIDPYLAGQFLALAGAAFVLYFAYKIADLMHEGAGIFAAVLIAFVPLFFAYSTVPMTDILSTAFALACVYFALVAPSKKNLFFSGLFAGLAFLFRFPQGLVLVVSGLVVLARQWKESGRFWSRELFIRIFWYALGFAAVAVPFLVGNFIAYHDPFLPLKAGSAIIAREPIMYLHPASFYVQALKDDSVFVLFGFIPVLFLIFKKRYRMSVPIFAGIVFLAVYLAYFTHLPHKELRYSLAFLPMAFTLAGVGVSLLLERIGSRCTAIIVFVLLGISGVYVSVPPLRHPEKDDAVYGRVAASLDAYERRTGSPAQVLSAAPFPASDGSSKIVDTLYDDWREVLPEYDADKGRITHVLTDTCTLEAACSYDSGCTEGKAEALAVFSKDSTVAVDGMAGRCRVTLYQLNQNP